MIAGACVRAGEAANDGEESISYTAAEASMGAASRESGGYSSGERGAVTETYYAAAAESMDELYSSDMLSRSGTIVRGSTQEEAI